MHRFCSVAIFMFRNSVSLGSLSLILFASYPFSSQDLIDIRLQLQPWHVPLACSFCSMGLNLGKFHIRLASVVSIQRSNRKICLSPLALASTRTQRFNEPGIQPRSKSLAAFSHCRCDTLEFSALTCSKSCFTRRAN